MPVDIAFYISIVSGALLTISEVLPYIKQINSNGIIETIINIIKKKQNNSPESEPLVSSTLSSKILETINKIEHTTIQMEKDIEKITIILE